MFQANPIRIFLQAVGLFEFELIRKIGPAGPVFIMGIAAAIGHTVQFLQHRELSRASGLGSVSVVCLICNSYHSAGLGTRTA